MKLSTTEPKLAHHSAETGAPKPAHIEDQVREDQLEKIKTPSAKSVATSNVTDLDERRSAPRFETFWELYPRKVKKPLAEAAYLRALKKATAEQIFAGLSEWVKYWIARNEPQFVPHPTSWLNGAQYNDRPEMPGPSKPATSEISAALDEVFTAVRSLGSYSSPPAWSSPAVAAAVRACGGWNTICATDERTARRTFANAYGKATA